MSKRKCEAIISNKRYLNASFIFCCSQCSSNSLPDTPHLARPPGAHLSTVSYISIDAHLTYIFCVDVVRKGSCWTRPDSDAPDRRDIGWIPRTKFCSQDKPEKEGLLLCPVAGQGPRVGVAAAGRTGLTPRLAGRGEAGL